MPTGDGRDPAERSDEATLIELTRTEPERVHPRRSRWTAVLIALFTALTCGGLASQTIVPRLIDRAADRNGSSAPATSPMPMPAAVPSERLAGGGSAIAVTRAEVIAGREPQVHLAGTAAVSVPTIEVTITMAGRSVGRAVVLVDPDATIVDVDSPIGRAPWFIDVPLPAGTTSNSPDGIAVAEVRWLVSSAGPAGSITSVIQIADGRSAP